MLNTFRMPLVLSWKYIVEPVRMKRALIVYRRSAKPFAHTLSGCAWKISNRTTSRSLFSWDGSIKFPLIAHVILILLSLKSQENEKSSGKIFEPPHDKTNKVAFAPSEESDQPGHPPSLISLRCPHEESLGPLLPIESTAKTLIRLGGCPGWSEFSLGARPFVGFIMRRVISQVLSILYSPANG